MRQLTRRVKRPSATGLKSAGFFGNCKMSATDGCVTKLAAMPYGDTMKFRMCLNMNSSISDMIRFVFKLWLDPSMGKEG